MYIFKYLDLKIFFISFVIGIAFIYFWGPDIKKVLIYPNPLNVDEIQYKDHTDTCFDFKSIKIPCPEDESLIKHVPIQ